MIGNTPDIDAVDDVVQDIDKLRQRHRDCEIHDIFNDTSFGKIVLCIGITHTNSFFLAFGYNLIL